MIIGIEGRTLQGERYGVARYLMNLLREMVKLEGENRYIVYTSGPIAPLGFDSPNLEIKSITMRPSLLWRHLRLPLAMRRDGVDLHFSPSYFLPLVKLCPAVVVVHDITFKVHPEWFVMDRRFRFDDLFWREVAKAERIVTVSDHSKRDIVRVLGVAEERVTVIREAADAFFVPVRDAERLDAVRERFGLAPGFLFTAGSIHTRRNLERLIAAVSAASGELDAPLELLILGTPAPFSPPVDIAGTARRCGMEERVKHVPYVSEEELLLLYNACGLFVYPSLYEGFGLPVIEAMACGAPVACSNTTSIPEVAGDAAAYFDPESTGEMAAAIREVMGDASLRDRLSRAGMERAATFSWRKAAEETLAVFKAAAGR
ncbi:MAG: glycosyltransferase family 1 protein [Actinomycetota bacterium]